MSLITQLQSTIESANDLNQIQEIRANIDGISAYLRTIKASFEQQNKAAEILGIHKSNIGRKLKELGIDANEFKP